MKQTKILAVLMTVVLLFGICAAGGNLLISNIFPVSDAQETDNDFAGLMEGLEINTGNLSGLLGDLENFNPDEIPNMILGGLFGSIATTAPVEDDQLSTITTIVQALLGGTQEGESTLDAIKDKLGDLGGTVSENELIQAIVSTLLGFDLSNFDMSMLTSNEFINTLMGNLGGLNLGGAQQVTTTVAAGSTQSAVITTIPQVSTTIPSMQNPSVNVPTSNIPNSGVPVISTQPQEGTTQYYLGNAGTIVENQSSDYVNNTIPSVNVPTAPSASDNQQQMPDGSKSVVSPKMIVGVLVLLLSGISVVAVVMVLKKKS
ncbi:MAG: hypothetical protein IJA31_04890 [Clostridia bacterium]|nr:hypothetical protein [Clostridia bacterium]